MSKEPLNGKPEQQLHPNPTASAQKRSTETATGLPVILVLTVPPKDRDLTQEREDEMRALLDTAGCEARAVAIQHIDKPVKATYIGKGKAQEIWDLIEDHEALEVVFDVSLTSQERNLERLLEAKVMDRSALILHISRRTPAPTKVCWRWNWRSSSTTVRASNASGITSTASRPG